MIFDKDGVIVDSEPLQYLAFKEVLAEYGHDYTTEDNQRLSIGKNGSQSYQAIAQKFGIGDIETLKKKRRARYFELAKAKLKMRKGALKLIRHLYQAGLPMAVASGSSEKLLYHDLAKFKVHRYFKAVVSGEYYQSKPHPEIFLVTAQKLDVSPANCVAIEDSQSGVEAAHAAGMVCIAVPHELTVQQDFSQANYITNSLEKINYQLIESLN